jgi:hypothetical protein
MNISKPSSIAVRLSLAVSLLLAAALAAQAELKFYTNVVMIQYYDGIGGTAVSALTGSPKFPNSPDRVVFAAIPEIPVDAANNYGTRITGVLFPQLQESFHLIMCSDDQGELYLSSNTNAANKVLVAREPIWNASRAWATANNRADTAKIDPAQLACNVSLPIVFNPGQPRYFELLAKEGSGGDNLAMTTSLEVSVTPVPPDGTPPDFTNFGLGVWADDVPKVITGPRLKRGSAVAGQETTFTAVYYAPPGTTTAYQWFRNNVAIGGATAPEYTFTPVAADAGATYRVQLTVDGKSAQSENVTLLFDVFSPGFAKVEIFHAIGGTAVASLTSAQKFIDDVPDEIRYVAGASSPSGIADDYGARMSFVFVPAEVGTYTFFTRSDDASQTFLSLDGTLDETTATLLAQETQCCAAFLESGEETSPPQVLLAGETNLLFGLVKEGAGGDYLQVAVREAADTTPAATLQPMGGPTMGVWASPMGVSLTVQNPQSTNIVEERTAIFQVPVVATPTHLPVLYQWQKNGVDIPGATGARLILTNVPISENNTTYRAIVSSIVGIQRTTDVARLTVVVDTFPPQPRVAALRGTVPGEFQISVTWDEAVVDEDASNPANYSVNPGTTASAKYWTNVQGMVITQTGLPQGSEVQVTVIGVRDTKGNRLSTATRSVTLTNLLSWTGIGGDQFNVERTTTDFSDGAVALGTKDFDLISGGHGYWENYDEATFVYEQITGDFDRAVRVEYQDPTSQWARTGLQVREALDSGVTRADIASTGYRFSQNFTIRVNPTATCVNDAANPGNNMYEILHRPLQGRNYDGFPAMYAIQNGFGGAPNYPTAWMRIKRVGQTIEAYKSDDGITWTGPASVTYTNDPATVDDPGTPDVDENIDESLAPTVYVGMFYAPEMNNNTTADCTDGSRVAKFRDYGPFGGGGGGPTLNITRNGSAVTLSWTGGGTLQEAPAITGPWTDSLSQANPQTFEAFHAFLDGAQDGGAGRTGTGVGTVALNPANNALNVNVTFSGLSANTTAGHIHGPAPRGAPANVMYGLTLNPLGATSGTISQTVTLVAGTQGFTIAQQLDQLRTGQWYINIHSVGPFSGGEIRGQLEPRGTKFFRLRP